MLNVSDTTYVRVEQTFNHQMICITLMTKNPKVRLIGINYFIDNSKPRFFFFIIESLMTLIYLFVRMRVENFLIFLISSELISRNRSLKDLKSLSEGFKALKKLSN